MFALHDESPIVLYSMSLSGGSKLSGLHVLITQYITSKCEIIDVIAIFKNVNSCENNLQNLTQKPRRNIAP